MTPLDQAWLNVTQNPQDSAARHAYYDLFLNTVFYVPTYDPQTQAPATAALGGDPLPLIMQVDGMQFMVFFDEPERVSLWAEGEVHCVEIPGYILARVSGSALHWGLNVGSDYQKEFTPDEIAWLKEVVRNAEAPADNR